MLLHAPVSIGDLLDRITILELKRTRVDVSARPGVEAELVALRAVWEGAGLGVVEEAAALTLVNTLLWDIEDGLRRHEVAGDFGPSFVTQAREVYLLNDRRAALKRAVNLRLGSELVEEKALPDYPKRP